MALDRNDGYRPLLSAHIQPNIGLDGDTRHLVIDILNQTLANEAILSQKIRGAHWNASGQGFFEERILFDSQYKQLNEISDQIAERVRILGGRALGSHQELIRASRLEEQPASDSDILHLLADHEACVRFLREDARKCSEEFEDEGTFNLLVGVMRLHEKMAWMFRAYIQHDPVRGDGQKKIT